jgi:hypothetical protein
MNRHRRPYAQQGTREREAMADTGRLSNFDSGETGVLADALIVTIFAAGDGEQALACARAWQPAVPQAAFVGIELDTPVRNADIAALRQAAADAAAARSIGPSQIILFGTGEAGRLAVDLVLRGAMTATGVIGLDISLADAPSPVLPTAAMVRLVQQGADDPARAARFRGLVEAMRRQHLDVRSMLLPDAATLSVTMRAGAVFLVELVAKASRVTAELGG